MPALQAPGSISGTSRVIVVADGRTVALPVADNGDGTWTVLSPGSLANKTLATAIHG